MEEQQSVISERIPLKSVEETCQDDYYEEEEINSSKYKYPQNFKNDYQPIQIKDQPVKHAFLTKENETTPAL